MARQITQVLHLWYRVLWQSLPSLTRTHTHADGVGSRQTEKHHLSPTISLLTRPHSTQN